MPEPFSDQFVMDFEAVLSPPRFGTYLRAARGDRANAAALYCWNTEISAAFYMPLQFAEIGARNGAIEAIAAEFGEDWHRSRGFQLTLREKIGNHLRPRRDLVNLSQRYATAGGVAAELKFAFWQHLFTVAQEPRLWTRHLHAAFPGIPAEVSVTQARERIHDDIQTIRALRNRIAHHEPIIARSLADDLACALRLAAWRRPSVAGWLQRGERVTSLLAARPA